MSTKQHHLDDLPGVLLPGTEGYERARMAWNLAVDQCPAAVAEPEDAAAVAELVRGAARAGVRVAVQATGHAAATLGPLERTLLLRTDRMRGVQVDPEARSARIEAGAQCCDLTTAAAAHGLAAHTGSANDVGLVGYLLGGGIGWLARRHGLAAGDVTAVELVTAVGTPLRADADHHEDLFWALRGGGGGLGVITAIELDLHPIAEVHAGALFWPVERSDEILRAWRAWCYTVPDDVTSVGRMMWFPPFPEIPEPLRGRGFAIVEAASLLDEQATDALLAPLRALAPEMDTFATIPTVELGALHMDPPGPSAAMLDHVLLDDVPDALIAALVGAGGPPLVSIELRQLGGALSADRPDCGAQGSIDGAFIMNAVAMTPDAASVPVATERLVALAGALAAWDTGRRYLNFVDSPADPARSLRADAIARLRAVKAAHDPTGLFHNSHRLVPA